MVLLQIYYKSELNQYSLHCLVGAALSYQHQSLSMQCASDYIRSANCTQSSSEVEPLALTLQQIDVLIHPAG